MRRRILLLPSPAGCDMEGTTKSVSGLLIYDSTRSMNKKFLESIETSDDEERTDTLARRRRAHCMCEPRMRCEPCRCPTNWKWHHISVRTFSNSRMIHFADFSEVNAPSRRSISRYASQNRAILAKSSD